tara:strand:- start:371 stop:478 length:108 start_codon:yes stop_codon:yes gene_type:complete
LLAKPPLEPSDKVIELTVTVFPVPTLLSEKVEEID